MWRHDKRQLSMTLTKHWKLNIESPGALILDFPPSSISLVFHYSDPNALRQVVHKDPMWSGPCLTKFTHLLCFCVSDFPPTILTFFQPLKCPMLFPVSEPLNMLFFWKYPFPCFLCKWPFEFSALMPLHQWDPPCLLVLSKLAPTIYHVALYLICFLQSAHHNLHLIFFYFLVYWPPFY